MFAPRYAITPATAKALMEIEANRQAVVELPINVEVLANLRETARLAATHYSTQIEGNRLTLAQVEEAVAGAHFPGRERDEAEVRNYYRALEHVERLGSQLGPMAEDDIRRIHGLVMSGRPRPTPYRDGQNVIRDSATGGIVYMPPEAHDVPGLMAELVEWVNAEQDRRELPLPIVAAIAHYQFATIHPHYDGNGRTARLLTTLILHRSGYGLKGIYSLEEHYVRDLGGYYAALSIGPSHNYYLGRTEAQTTGFLDYFCRSMADAFSAVRAQAARAAQRDPRDASPLLRQLDPRQRRLLALYRDRSVATTAEIGAYLGVAPRTAADLCRRWVTEGFLDIHDMSRKRRSYRLGPAYERIINPSA